ncbi:hypothetical protein BJ138DRAFT_968021, partial [Hygrophoropsis aurantiaca]
GDSGNFKEAMYCGAADAIAPLLTRGPVKTSQMVRSKWASLKQTYNATESWRNKSGTHWDNIRGTNI